MKNRNNKISKVIIIVVVLIAMTTTLGCKKTYVEENYTGKVVGVEICSTRSNGYLVDLKTPEGIGDSIVIEGKTYKNVVIGYEAPEQLKINQQISGVMYKTKGYSALNCVMFDTRNLQEIIILSVDEK